MAEPRRTAVVALVAWTGLVWTTRIRNIWTDDALDASEQWARTALAGSFSILGVLLAVALWRRARWARGAVAALGVWTTAVWVVRAVGIATGDHDAGFVAVHLVLAIVSIGLSVLAWREVRSSDRGLDRPVRADSAHAGPDDEVAAV